MEEKNRDGNYVPKREPDITLGIATFLNVYGAMKNFDVACETSVGNGNIDFYITAQVNKIGITKIAIEAKKAESNDLVKGLSNQLPEYMSRMKTSYGIYLVYWMKSFDYPCPTYNSYVELEIDKLHPIRKIGNIRTLGMNLSREKSPSQI